MILNQNFNTCLLIIFHLNKVRKDDWRCLRLLNRPRRLLTKSSIFRWSYWIFPKRLTPDFESKLKNCLFDYILLNRVRKDDWRCLRLLKRPKRPSIKSSILGWPYSWIFQRVNPWFWVKMWKLFFWSYFFW